MVLGKTTGQRSARSEFNSRYLNWFLEPCSGTYKTERATGGFDNFVNLGFCVAFPSSTTWHKINSPFSSFFIFFFFKKMFFSFFQGFLWSLMWLAQNILRCLVVDPYKY